MLPLILLVDDNEEILDFLERVLSSKYSILKAEDGLEAIKLLETEAVQLIISDVMMPVMDGIEACKRIKEIPELYKTSVLVLTARTEEYTEVAAFDVGADDFISKPIKPKALISRIATVLKREKKSSEEKFVSEKAKSLFHVSEKRFAFRLIQPKSCGIGCSFHLNVVSCFLRRLKI